MTCREIVDFLMAYLDGELPAEQKALFEKHLGCCPPCVDYLESYRLTIRLEREACAGEGKGCEEVPEDLIRAILAARKQGS